MECKAYENNNPALSSVVLKITPKGFNVLYGKEDAKALKREESKTKVRIMGSGQYDEALFERLRSLRKKIAEEHQVPPYVIFSDKTLHEMCRHFPTTLPGMRRISGVGDAKLERYGEDFLSEIKRYLTENPGISVPESRPSDFNHVGRQKTKKKGETLEETYKFFKLDMSLDDIAKQRNLALSTIASHLERLIREGRNIDVDRLINPGKLKEIEDVFLSFGQWNLNPVVEHFNGAVSYEEARIARAWLLSKAR